LGNYGWVSGLGVGGFGLGIYFVIGNGLLVEFTLYDNFISSDYLFKHIDFNPDEKLKRIGDGFYEQKLIRDQLLAQTGRRFLTKDITSDNAQYQQLMDNTITQQRDLELTPGISLSADQVAQLTQDIVWMEPQTITLADGTTTQALVPRVYIANASQYQVEGGRIIAGKDISLNVDQLKNAGLIKAGDNLSVSALDSILNQGGTLQADNTLTLLAGNDISNISANIQAKNITLTSIDGNINNTRFEQQADYSHTNTIDIKKVIGVQSNIIANNISLTTNKDINLAGSNLNAGNTLDLSANNVVLTTTQQVSVFDSGNAQNYLKENSTTNLKSQVKANNINIDVVEQVNIKGASIQADNQINIQSKVLDIASAKDTSFSELHSESKGDLFGGGHDDTTITSTSTNIQSTLQAKDINITSSLTQVQASKVKANTIKITTDLLNLVSDKDLDFKQVKTDSSGLLTKTITDKGHNKQTKIVAQLDATDQLNINNQQLTSTQQQLKQLSSADALNAQLAQQLKAQGITLNDIKISNSSWDESSTTLSGLGKIIVQLAANAIVPGAGGGFINAAMASVQTQLASAVLTAGITGNDLDIDPKAILKTALTAGANQYALDQYGASSIDADGLKTTTYNSEIDFSTNLQNGLQNTVITTAVSTAINGGSLADNLESNLANSVLTTVTAKGANIIGTNKANLGEIGHKVAHAALGCAGAKIQGKDCSSGAVGAVSGEIIAEQLGKNADLSDENVVAISRIGTGIIAQGLGKDVEVADKAGVNAVENNALATGAVLLTVAAVAELIDKGVTTYDAWQLKKALDEGRNEDAKALAVVIGVGVITEVIPGNKIIQKVVNRAKNPVKNLDKTVGKKAITPNTKVTKIKYISGKKLNQLENKGSNIPKEDAWVNDSSPIERTFDVDAGPGLSRVHLDPKRPEGNWVGKTEDFHNTNGTLKSAPTIKKEFSLPSTPEYITPVKKVKFKGLTGKAAKNKFGTGGKQQIKILEENYGKLEEFFDATKTTKLPQ
jgi:filamentous hemagglutinin